MDDLKQSVQNAVYEQKDPLLIYKFESFGLFKSMMSKMNTQIVSFLFKAALPEQEERSSTVRDAGRQQRRREKLNATKEDFFTEGEQQIQQQTPIVNEMKIGRNVRVSIKNISTGEDKILKYKQAKPLIDQGNWVLLEQV